MGPTGAEFVVAHEIGTDFYTLKTSNFLILVELLGDVGWLQRFGF
jgi:hypothetical protein